MGGSALGDPGGREEGVALVDTRAGNTVGGSALGDTGGGSGDTGDTGIVVSGAGSDGFVDVVAVVALQLSLAW